MSWQPFDLDHAAQVIVLKARERDAQSLNQAYKMRAACSYGLERFWGEHLRLAKKEPEKAAFIADTWREFVRLMAEAGITDLPAVMPGGDAPVAQIRALTDRLWNPEVLSLRDQQVCLSVLSALCDAIVWWTQRLKR